MKTILIVLLALAGMTAAAPIASAEPICVGDGILGFCVDSAIVGDPRDAIALPIYCLQVQDAPCPNPNV